VESIRTAIEDERRLEALVDRAARPPLRTTEAALLRDKARDVRDQARILLRHLRDLTEGIRPGHPGRFPRRTVPLGKTEPMATIREAPSVILGLIARYRDLLRTVDDRYLRAYLRVLIENRLDLSVYIEATVEDVERRARVEISYD